jgi:hypothetical protein
VDFEADMQTGCEDYDDYIAAGRGEDRQRVIDECNERFSEQITSEQEAVWSVSIGRNLQLPMVWTARAIAHFIGGKRDG